jgi:hypothetical protein
MVYAGIGSRQTPKDILAVMTDVADLLAQANGVLRTGAAPGADQAFEFGATLGGGEIETYLPWEGFEGRQDGTLLEPSKLALEVGEEFHPRWKYLKQGAKKLIARNSHQVLGKSLDEPANLIVCWTPDGKPSGGTGQALRIAAAYEIPVLNLQREEDLTATLEMLAE